MKYSQLYSALNTTFSFGEAQIEFEDMIFQQCQFNSLSYSLLPGNSSYYCRQHRVDIPAAVLPFNDVGEIRKDVHQEDTDVYENQQFHYYLLKPKGQGVVDKVIFLLHGFNEKNWEKYLPWGKTLCELTGHAILFFPIAFHMQRAPASWSEKRSMFKLSEERKKRYPNINRSTLSNVAISMRLHAYPQRFIWSGLQTYYDFIKLLEECKSGAQPHIARGFTFSIFAYSIGGLLAQILKLSNYGNYFDDVRVGLFCGGAVFNRMQPVSKFILDSEAKVALYYFLIEHLDGFLKRDAQLRHFLEEGHVEGQVFRAMLDFQKMRGFREQLFENTRNDFYAIGLKNDEVVPSYEIMNTLQGAFRNVRIRVDEFDFPYPYTHENPFPADHQHQDPVNECFNQVFNRMAAFLSGKQAKKIPSTTGPFL